MTGVPKEISSLVYVDKYQDEGNKEGKEAGLLIPTDRRPSNEYFLLFLIFGVEFMALLMLNKCSLLSHTLKSRGHLALNFYNCPALL